MIMLLDRQGTLGNAVAGCPLSNSTISSIAGGFYPAESTFKLINYPQWTPLITAETPVFTDVGGRHARSDAQLI